jgi:hypothetical protein
VGERVEIVANLQVLYPDVEYFGFDYKKKLTRGARDVARSNQDIRRYLLTLSNRSAEFRGGWFWLTRARRRSSMIACWQAHP